MKYSIIQITTGEKPFNQIELQLDVYGYWVTIPADEQNGNFWDNSSRIINKNQNSCHSIKLRYKFILPYSQDILAPVNISQIIPQVWASHIGSFYQQKITISFEERKFRNF